MRVREGRGLAFGLVCGAVVAVAWAAHGVLAYQDSRERLDGFVGELGAAVVETAAAGLRSSMAVLDELERDLEANLRLKASLLSDAGEQDALLRRYALAAGLRHVLLFDRAGTLLATARDVPPPGDGAAIDPDRLGRALEEAARGLIAEASPTLLVRDWSVPAAGLKSALVLVARMPADRVAVLVQDAEQFARVRRAAGADALGRRLESEARIAYVRYGAPAPPADPSRVLALERAVGDEILRVGVDRTVVARVLSVQKRSAWLYGAVFVAVVTIAGWGVARLRRSRDALQARLRRGERLASLGRLAAGIAHEVRNPLNAIGIAVQRVQRTADASPEINRLAGVVLGEVERLDRTVEEVLRAARPVPPRLAEVDAAEWIAAVELLVRPEAAERGVDLRVEVAPGVRFPGDADLLRGAAWNLVRNAVQASPAKGEVAVCVRRQGDEVLLEVSDRGSGISDEERERLFEPFHGKRAGGSGLGLPLALSAAEAHGGTIDVEKRSGGGSLFRLRIPATMVEN